VVFLITAAVVRFRSSRGDLFDVTCPLMTHLRVTLIILSAAAVVAAQSPPPSGPPASVVGPAPVFSEFQIGPEDVLGVVFWREKDLTLDVTVRPDGVVTIPLIGEMQTAGKTPTVLASEIQKAAGRYLTEPNVTVIVRQINSRKIYITGEVNAPGAYPLTRPLTIVQAIALAGGVREFAERSDITVLRQEEGRTRALTFNYEDVARGRRLEQNLELRPGDTIVVP
jgi:polysaccharide export outer membrane protein